MIAKDVAQSYTYNSDGNVVSSSANAEQKNDMIKFGYRLYTKG